MTAADGFRASPEVRFRRIAGEAVVLLQDAGEVLALNEIGARILELIDGKLSVAEVTDRLSDEFEVDRFVLETDVAEFVQELLENGVIEAVSVEEEGPDGP